jgi:hypothetical protein
VEGGPIPPAGAKTVFVQGAAMMTVAFLVGFWLAPKGLPSLGSCTVSPPLQSSDARTVSLWLTWLSVLGGASFLIRLLVRSASLKNRKPWDVGNPLFFSSKRFAGLPMWDAAYREFGVRWGTLSMRDRLATAAEISIAVLLVVACPVAKFLLPDRCIASCVGESVCGDVIAVLGANAVIVVLYYDFLIKFPLLQYQKRTTTFGSVVSDS